MPKMRAQDVIDIYRVLHNKKPKAAFPDLWLLVKEEFNKLGASKGISDVGQTWKTTGGKAFETLTAEYVAGIVGKKWFSDRKINASSWYKLADAEKTRLSYEFERRCCGLRFMISNEPDIVIFKGKRPKVIISCKSSLRDRVNMDLFWAQHYREKGYIFTLVCAETGDTIGTCKKPKKPRKLAEAIYDRLYIVNGQIDYCDIVRPLNDIERDLKRWLGE